MNVEPIASEGTDGPNRKWSAAAKRLILGVVAGAIVTSLPWLVNKLNVDALWPINPLLMPGAIVALAMSGNVHNYSFTLLLVANVILYAALVYIFLSKYKKLKS